MTVMIIGVILGMTSLCLKPNKLFHVFILNHVAKLCLPHPPQTSMLKP